jgi:hypothetical protein
MESVRSYFACFKFIQIVVQAIVRFKKIIHELQAMEALVKLAAFMVELCHIVERQALQQVVRVLIVSSNWCDMENHFIDSNSMLVNQRSSSLGPTCMGDHGYVE